MTTVTRVQTRITLKNFKHAAFASEETTCFSAVVCFDGVAFADAKNDGHGGCTDYRPLWIRGNDRPSPSVMQAFHAAEAFAKSLPPSVFEMKHDGGATEKYEVASDLEHVIDDLVHLELVRKDFKRDMKKLTFVAPDGGVRYLKGKAPAVGSAEWNSGVAFIRGKYPTAVILNTLPEAEAFELYRQQA